MAISNLRRASIVLELPHKFKDLYWSDSRIVSRSNAELKQQQISRQQKKYVSSIYIVKDNDLAPYSPTLFLRP